MPTENDPLQRLPDFDLDVSTRVKKKKVKKKRYWAKNLYRKTDQAGYLASLYFRRTFAYADDGSDTGKGGGFVPPEISRKWVAKRLAQFDLHNNVGSSTKSQRPPKAERLRKVKSETIRDFPRFTGDRREGLGAYMPFPSFADIGRESGSVENMA